MQLVGSVLVLGGRSLPAGPGQARREVDQSVTERLRATSTRRQPELDFLAGFKVLNALE